MASIALRTLEETGPSLVLAPERFRAEELEVALGGVPLRELVTERRELVRPRDTAAAIVIDTTHAREGILDVPAAVRASRGAAASPKKRVRPGDLLVSRLRPYLRQIALAHPAAAASGDGRPFCCSTEFYVLSPREPGGDLSFLLPFLLSERVQGVLCAGQEGGHHPRVPRETLFSLRVSEALLERRARVAAEISRSLQGFYGAASAYREAIVTGLDGDPRIDLAS
jgi:hypothetical protein